MCTHLDKQRSGHAKILINVEEDTKTILQGINHLSSVSRIINDIGEMFENHMIQLLQVRCFPKKSVVRV